MEPNEADVLRMRRERDLYRKLTQLGDHVDVDPFLADALAAVVELSGAAHGLLEVYDDHDGPA
ncbi:MAG: hypothetical protein ABIR79_23965, partial [Candidatus Binatia bacterium]